MNIHIRLLAAVLLGMTSAFSNSLFAQEKTKKSKEINWSINLYKNQDSIRTTYFNLGLLSNLREQHGVGINLISSVVHQSVKGLQLSGILSFTGKDAKGVQIGGLANMVRMDASGFMLGGLMNATGGNAGGFQLAGIVNITGKRYNGLALGGMLNVSSDEMNGVQLSSILNASGGTMKGVQLALLTNVGVDIAGLQASLISNIAAKRVQGLQLGGVVNIAVNTEKALQLASLTNVCLGEMQGVQLAFGNYAEDVKGTQLGLLNLSTGVVNGWQIGVINHSKDTTAHKVGLININPKTKIQAMLFGGNTSKINVAVRFKNRRNYSILGFGSHYLDLNDRFSGCLYYRTGIYFPIKKKFEISGDLGYFHIENFENEDVEIPERMYSLQGRINVEYKLMRKLSFFVSTGYSMTRYYQQNKFFEKKAIIEGGIILF